MDDIPLILYKYRDWDNNFHERILLNQEIYLSSASKFNDPFEGNIPFIYDEAELKPEKVFLKMLEMAEEDDPSLGHAIAFDYQKRDLLHDPKHLEECKKENQESIEKKFGILCLTSKCNNFLMWSHYANSHKGFCVGFDSRLLFKVLDCLIVPVRYKEDIPKFKLNEPIEDFTKKLLATKGSIWEYEEEYRIIKPEGANKIYSIPRECISELLFGAKMDHQTKLGIIKFISKEIPHCMVYEMQQSTTKFELLKNRIF